MREMEGAQGLISGNAESHSKVQNNTDFELPQAIMSVEMDEPNRTLELSQPSINDHDTKTSTFKSEGKAKIFMNQNSGIFYNAVQEVNRDISILAIETFIKMPAMGKKGNPENISILEAMSASGIRAIRYALEISGVNEILANDMSKKSYLAIQQNSVQNGVSNVVKAALNDACTLMYSSPDTHFVVDIDPYGTPVPFLDAAIKCVMDGGLLLITATDLAILCGNAPESCFAKYGSMSLKSSACHELALRIVIHSVQAAANRQGWYVEPLLSVKIDFYVRLVFRVRKGPKVCKNTVSCQTFTLQPLGIRKPDGNHGFATGPSVPQLCVECSSTYHIGGPIWAGPIHEKAFVSSMMQTLKTTHDYLGTFKRLTGLLSMVLEEVEAPLYYKINRLCSFVKEPTIPMLKFRSALMNLGYEVSLSHTSPDTIKTTAPNSVLWDVIRTWAANYSVQSAADKKLNVQSPSRILMSKPKELWIQGISFDLHTDANPASRHDGVLRFQRLPNFGPGIRGVINIPSSGESEEPPHGQGEKRKLESS